MSNEINPADFFTTENVGAVQAKERDFKENGGGFEESKPMFDIGTFEADVVGGRLFKSEKKGSKYEKKVIAVIEIRATSVPDGSPYKVGQLYSTFNCLGYGVPSLRTTVDEINYREVLAHLGAIHDDDLFTLSEVEATECARESFKDGGSLLIGAKVKVKIEGTGKIRDPETKQEWTRTRFEHIALPEALK